MSTLKSKRFYENKVKCLKERLNEAELRLMGADHDYDENPNELTLESYRLANESYNILYMELQANEDIANNYRFYEKCYDEMVRECVTARVA